MIDILNTTKGVRGIGWCYENDDVFGIDMYNREIHNWIERYRIRMRKVEGK